MKKWVLLSIFFSVMDRLRIILSVLAAFYNMILGSSQDGLGSYVWPAHDS